MGSQASVYPNAAAQEALRERALLAWGNVNTASAIQRSLSLSFDVTWSNHGRKALAMLEDEPIAAAVIDERLPGLDGYAIARQLNSAGPAKRPQLLLVVSNDPAQAAAARDAGEIDSFIATPFSDGAFLQTFWEMRDRVAEQRWGSLSKLQSSLLKVTRRNLRRIVDQASAQGGFEFGLVRECCAIAVQAARADDLQFVLHELRDHHNYTFVHSLNVASMMAIFGAHIGLRNADIELLAQVGLVHDLGKAMVGVDILNKPSGLDAAEWEVMRRHPRTSGEILRCTPETPREVLYAAERHHEKLDGTGYPFGLSGAEIDDVGRISGICDVYSALTEKRSYKAAMQPQRAAEVLTGMAGTHLDPDLVPKFLEMVWDGKLSHAHDTCDAAQ